MARRGKAVTAEQLLAAPEVFLTGTTTDVMPIVAIDNARIGDGRPGTVTRALADDLAGRFAALST